ncbi:MAG TPA: hypothetical protein DDW52_21440, partial [Planctomycetaceae bacterium]|nr:hypothetical protein [Planctomycetaceae bacterium]
MATGKLLLSKQVGYDVLVGAAWSPDGQLLAFGCSDNTLRAIDTSTGEQKLHQGAHDDWLRDCVFTPDGKHLLSAARDMTVKLTEVATERFIDNVTSITPGALRGGVNALAMHPERPELLVGGADGVPKVYRVFRETERRIGDDANLVRRFPAQPGRAFAVAISQDGKWLAAASSLDGRSHVAVYPYNFDGKLPEDVRAAMAKRVSSRSAEDKKLIETYVSSAPAAAWSKDFEANSIYALAFDATSTSVLLGGASGYVEQADISDGAVSKRFTPFPLADQTELAIGDEQSLKVASGLDRIPQESASQTDPQEFVRLEVSPAEITLESSQAYVQCVVRAQDKSGNWHDVTRLASFECAGLDITDEGLVRGQGSAGDSELHIHVGDLQQSLPVTVGVSQTPEPVDFLRDVNPILSRLGCNSGTCHGAQKGKAGFKLSLRGYDPLEDLRALSDDLESRRLNIAVPDASLMLLKPLGAIPHEGGVLMSKDSDYYQVLRRWIEEGARLKRDTQKVKSIEVFPKNPVVQREGAWQQFRVVATFPDGTKHDVTREAFIESGNTEVATSHPTGLVQALRRGEAPMLARYEGAYAATTVTVMGDRSGFAWQEPAVNNHIDSLVASKWERMKIQPSGLCTDAEFLRRVSLDLTGLPPTVQEVRSFLDDPAPASEKRRRKIDELIGSAGYVEHWTNKWADLLQVNSKFLGQDGAKALRQWIRSSVAENKPYDRFVRDILTATGSNKENPAASYFKILRDPDLMMENTTHLFLAVRFNCNKCHDHPFEKWTQDQYYELAAFFAQTKLSADPAAKNKKIGGTAVEGAKPLYEIVSDAQSGEITHVRTGAD